MINTRVLAKGIILNQKYEIKSVLGEGGFGITYRAMDTVIDETVAIKEYFPSAYATRDNTNGKTSELTVITGESMEGFHKGLEKFVNEAASLAKFQQEEGIVSVKNFFYENNTAYMVMEYIDGITLKEYLKQNGDKLPYGTVLSMMKPVMQSLSVVHKSEIVHRDISPDNIMVVKEGRLKLIDFGAARFIGNEDEKSLTVILKEGYAPPEQYQTNGRQGEWTDVYAVCAVMYQMITGIVPIESPARVMDGDSLAQIREIPRKVNRAIMKGMSIGIIDRYQTVVDALNDLEKSCKRLRKRTTIVGLMGAIIIITIIFNAPIFKVKNIMEAVETKEISKENVGEESLELEKIENVEKEVIEDKVRYMQLSQTELEKAILDKSGKDVCVIDSDNTCVIYDDFNGDGIKELFMLVGTQSLEYYDGDDKFFASETNGEIWFANDKLTKKVTELMTNGEGGIEMDLLQFGKSNHLCFRHSFSDEGCLLTICQYSEETGPTVTFNKSALYNINTIQMDYTDFVTANGKTYCVVSGSAPEDEEWFYDENFWWLGNYQYYPVYFHNNNYYEYGAKELPYEIFYSKYGIDSSDLVDIFFDISSDNPYDDNIDLPQNNTIDRYDFDKTYCSLVDDYVLSCEDGTYFINLYLYLKSDYSRYISVNLEMYETIDGLLCMGKHLGYHYPIGTSFDVTFPE